MNLILKNMQNKVFHFSTSYYHGIQKWISYICLWNVRRHKVHKHSANCHSLKALKQRPVVINTSRGEVVDNQALTEALTDGIIRDAVIDTWENEPDINRSLLEKVYIGTPHIAGYSADGKANATRMSLEAVCHFLNRPMTFEIQPPALPESFRPSADPDTLALQLYDPRKDSERLRSAPEMFEYQRGHYPLRRERFT